MKVQQVRWSLLLAVTALALASSALVVAPAKSASEVDRAVTVDVNAPEATWEGPATTAANVQYDSAAGGPCGKNVEDYCDLTLLEVDLDPTFWNTHTGGVTVNLGDYQPNSASDFDLYVYESDESGNRGTLVDFDGDVAGVPEEVVIPKASGHYLVVVVYFATTASSYTGTATLESKDLPAPLDIDAPKGLQEYLASDPSKGYRSHSEPHIAQSPVDPNVLVAGSKMYNLDPDSLDEYEFKIGTYASFDGGLTWTDLGQLGVCPADEPPETLTENTHTCYPADDPTLGGTGEEDVDDPDDPDDPFDPRGSGDEGEEYITSDVWVQFDDEGNAYAMVLDAPAFDSGAGWGMSFHRWESVSPEDLETGNMWSERIPINAYPDADSLRRDALGFLDDKNTFAVNNAGPDGDGETGTMISCWGQTISELIKQQIVCERSTDGGKTWPDEPTVISGVQHLVIGVDVVADTTNPDTFYATWAQYATGGTASDQGGELTPETLEFARTTDGGETWELRALPITTLTGIPRQFPGQRFRNLTLPIMAVGPENELYITYAEYHDAPDPTNDEDAKQADIMLVKSTDGGDSWSEEPKNLTGDTGPDTNPNADQFQPSVAVTPAGQVNVSYFDRRMDVRTDTNPGNYFVDTWLSRSNDGGETFTDIRVSHDLSDPEHNAPVDSGGSLFYGDYQGLVADDCAAIPFVNDAHRALDLSRDPAFDHDETTSDFQEVVAWRVPNIEAFGGGETSCPPDLVVTPRDVQASSSGRFRKLTGTVRNVGLTPASGVLVLFEVDGREVALRRVGSLPAGGVAKVSVIWDTHDRPGDYMVTVTADPDDQIEEATETNNKAGMTVRIEPPHTHTTAGRRPM